MDWERVLFERPSLRGWACGLLVAVPILAATFLVTDSSALRILGAAAAGLLLRVVAWRVDSLPHRGRPPTA